MDYFVAVITLLVLAFLYWRMIRREMPRPVSPFQAILPFALGIVSMLIYGPCLIGFIRQFSHMSVYLSEAPPVLQGMLKAFLMAGFPEEMLKMIFILIALVVLRSRVRNVYEYILIGAAIGAGFTVAEEWLYADTFQVSVFVIRMVGVAAHMAFNMVMGEYLGRARVCKLTGQGSPVKYTILAFAIPCIIHTLYDTCITGNVLLQDGSTAALGGVIMVAAVALLVVFQFVVLIRFRKKTEEFCAMSVQLKDDPI